MKYLNPHLSWWSRFRLFFKPVYTHTEHEPEGTFITKYKELDGKRVIIELIMHEGPKQSPDNHARKLNKKVWYK